MPKPASTPRDTRSAILAAAIEILHAQGAGALTVRSVAAAAGCSTTGVYTWFGGKSGLVEAIFIDGFQRFGAALVAAGAGAGPEPPALVDMARAYRRWAIANPTHYMVMFGRAVPDFHPSTAALLTAHGTFRQLVDVTATTMVRLGIGGDATETAHHLWAGMHGYVSLEIANMDMAVDESHRERRFDDGVGLMVRSWLGHGPALTTG